MPLIEGAKAMTTREEAIFFCNSLENVLEDYPFHDSNWALMRHAGNKKTFACIYERMDQIWINVKCDPAWRDFWRSAFESIVPAYHMNKEHWITVLLDGSYPKEKMFTLIDLSYDLTK